MTPLMTYLVVFIAVVVVAGIAVGIYYSVKEDNKKELPTLSDVNWVATGGVLNGGNGNILYSENGKEWQESTGVSFSIFGNKVAYGTSNGTSPLWIAVGYNEGGSSFGNILYSENGKEWQESIGLSFALSGNGVAYGTSNGTSPLWIAVGDNKETTSVGNILFSIDGKEWQESTGLSFSTKGIGVAYGTSSSNNPLWVAVGDNEGGTSFGNIIYSENGKEWQESTGMSFSLRGRGIAYGTSNGTSPLWVAVGDDNGGNGSIIYSEDGKEWQESKGLSFSNFGIEIAYGTSNGSRPLWVAVGQSSESDLYNGNIMYSEDGKEWHLSTGKSFAYRGHGIAYGTSNGAPLWVAVGDNQDGSQGIALFSTDGKEWQVPEDPNIFSFGSRNIAFKFFLPNVPDFAPVPYVPPIPPPFLDEWVAVGDDSGGNGSVLYSKGGKEWQESTGTSFFDSGNKVAYGTSNGTSPLWVVVGDDNGGNGNIIYSEDGKDWKESVGMSFSSAGYGIAYGTSNGTSPLWVASGNDGGGGKGNGSLLYSADGKEWQESTGMSFVNYGTGVAYGTSNGTSPLWVALGNDPSGNRVIMHSADGKEWQDSTGINFNPQGNGVAYGTSNGTSPLWVAVGNEKIVFSTNGKNWQEPEDPNIFSTKGNGVAYGTSNGTSPLWVAVGKDTGGGNSNVFYSADGKEWQQSTGASFQNEAKAIAYGTSNNTPLWIAVGSDTISAGPGKTIFSTNGKDWQEPEDPNIFSINGYGIAYNSILPNIPNFY